jgi:DNA mismatch repair protein MutH
MREQPYNSEKASQRAFCLKSSYVNSIISELYNKKNQHKENYIKLMSPMDISVEESLYKRFSKYYQKSLKEIYELLNIELNLGSKQFYNTVVNKILGGKGDSTIIELEKAGIKTKVFRIDNNDKMPESLSFPAFNFIELANEEWDNSELKEMFESTKFLFVVFKMNCKNEEYKKLDDEEKIISLRLEKIILWNMPMEIIEKDVRKTWEKTKEVILQGVPREKRGNKVFNDFPSSKLEYNVVHVRPHARDREDTLLLPNGDRFTKQSFWLSGKYIEKIINN